MQMSVFGTLQVQPSWEADLKKMQAGQMTAEEAKRFASTRNAENRARAMNSVSRPAAARRPASVARSGASTSPAVAASWDRAFARVGGRR